jgi:hypothetical protein
VKFFRIGMLAGLVLGLSGAAIAQSPMQLLSTVRPGEAPPQSCLAAANVLQRNLAQSAQPKGWVNVVACDEVAWENALEVPGHRIAYQGNALLDFTARTKVFNAAEYPVRRVKGFEPRMAMGLPKGSPDSVVSPHAAVSAIVPAM